MILRDYATCVKELETNHRLTRRAIADLIGVDPAVLSRRVRSRNTPIREALIVINILVEIFNSQAREREFPLNKTGWIGKTMQAAKDMYELGNKAA